MNFKNLILAALVFTSTASYAEAATSGQTALLHRLYKEALGRDMDWPGFVYWTNQLDSQPCSQQQAATLAGSFFGSAEFLSRNISNKGAIYGVYNAVLNRPADAAGYMYYSGLMYSQGKTAASIAVELANSPEFTQSQLTSFCQ